MKKLLAAVAITALLSGCAIPLQHSAYSRGDALAVMSVRNGTLEGVRTVKLSGTLSGVGALAGGAIGGIAGSGIGKGKGKMIATILGALAGAGVGAALEESNTTTMGEELIIRLDNNELIAVVQEFGEERFQAGQRVRVLANQRAVRVTPL